MVRHRSRAAAVGRRASGRPLRRSLLGGLTAACGDLPVPFPPHPPCLQTPRSRRLRAARAAFLVTYRPADSRRCANPKRSDGVGGDEEPVWVKVVPTESAAFGAAGFGRPPAFSGATVTFP